MSSAREKFYNTAQVIRGLVDEAIATDVMPANELHTIRARIIRSSLIVSVFSHLEAYIEERLDEVLQVLTGTRISFSDFDSKMKTFFSVSAVNGLSRRIAFLGADEALLFADAHLTRLASFKGNPPTFTGFGFSPKSSNVSANDINDLLRAFGVDDVWRKLGRICSDVGISRLNLHDDFINLCRVRNKAAHDSGTNIPTADLVAHIETAVLVGLSVDLVLTHAIRCHSQASNSNAAAKAAKVLNLRMRFLDLDATGSYRETAAGATRAYRVHNDLSEARKSPSRPYQGFIVRDSRLFPLRVL